MTPESQQEANWDLAETLNALMANPNTVEHHSLL